MDKQLTELGRWVDQVRGRSAKLAKSLGVKPAQVSKWRTRPVPLRQCAKVEEITGIKVELLRPDEQWIRKRGEPVAVALSAPARMTAKEPS